MSFKDVLNKNYAHTQNSVKKYEVGGKVVTKEGATNDAKKGGYFDGRPHSKGGIKAVNIDNNQPIEVEGGEVVITKRAVADDTKKEFEGKMMTNKQILSKINESGGGVSFEKGGQVKSDNSSFSNGGKLDEDEYYISDEDLNFEIDEKEFADGGVTPTKNEIETLTIRINDIQDPEKLNNKGIAKKYRGTYEQIFAMVVSAEDVDEKFESFGQNEKGKDFNYFTITLTNPVLRFDTDQEGVEFFKNLFGVDYVKVIYKNALSTQEVKILDIVNLKNLQNEFADLEELQDALVQKKTVLMDAFTKTDLKNALKKLNGGTDGKGIYYLSNTKGYSGTRKKEYYGITQEGIDYLKNLSLSNSNTPTADENQELPSTVEFPYFAPDAVKEYNPEALTVEKRRIDNLLITQEFENKIEKKKKIVNTATEILKDIPVENVLERVELSLLRDAEEKELQLLENPTLQKVKKEFSLRFYSGNILEDLIQAGQIEQTNLVNFRPNETNLRSKYNSLMQYVIDYPISYVAHWIENFFGKFMLYSDSYNFDYASLSNFSNIPSTISKVGRLLNLNNKRVMYVPELVFQGLSQPYDRVGFEVFPISYYATNWDYADWFATTKGQKLNTRGVILPCFLNIRRPLELSFFSIQKVSPTQFFDAVYLQTGLTPEELKVNPAFLSPNTPDMEVWVYIRSNTEMLKILKESKIVDGIHMYENNPAVDENDAAYMTEVWVTFYPEQTKVAPLFQYADVIYGARKEVDRGWFTKSQFLKSGGTI